MTFADPAITGYTLISNGIGGTFTFDGSTLYFNSPGISDAVGSDTTLTAVFAYTEGPVTPPAVAPEPSSLMLLGTGGLAVAGMLRRRLVA